MGFGFLEGGENAAKQEAGGGEDGGQKRSTGQAAVAFTDKSTVSRHRQDTKFKSKAMPSLACPALAYLLWGNSSSLSPWCCWQWEEALGSEKREAWDSLAWERETQELLSTTEQEGTT